MMRSRKCPPGCACGKHTPGRKRSCLEGCTCGKHSKPRKIDWQSEEVRREYLREQARVRRAANPEAHRVANQRYYSNNPYSFRYGLTKGAWQRLLESQDSCCYLCGDPLDFDGDRKIHVDHDHACCSGQRTCGLCVRGLTCSPCNVGIGSFGDDPDRMLRVADNLEAADAQLQQQRAALQAKAQES